MTGNTKVLDEILNAVTNFTYDAMAHPGDPLVGTLPTMDKATAKLAILDWHNKQLLNELETLRSTATNPAHRDDLYYFDIGYSLVERIQKLKESK